MDVGADAGRTGMMRSRVTKRLERIATHHLGSGHVSSMQFAITHQRQWTDSSDLPSSLKTPVPPGPHLVLASSHFVDHSLNYNKPGGCVLVDVNQPDPSIVGENGVSHPWTHPTGAMLHASVMDMSFDPDGEFLFTVGDRDPWIKGWDPLTGRSKIVAEVPDAMEGQWGRRAPRFRNMGFQKLAVMPKNPGPCVVAGASYDGSARVFGLFQLPDDEEWRVGDLSPALLPEETSSQDAYRVATTVTFGRVSSFGRLIVGHERRRGERDSGVVRLYDLQKSQLFATWDVGENAVASVEVSPSGKWAVVGVTGNAALPGENGAHFTQYGDGILRIFDVAGEATRSCLELRTGQLDVNIAGFR
ncbi:hypothetical protein HKX48_007443 [Thoreauomyces humboldtii]|nr:hypothetical protein HKX48_007443 [Thoreauomyces humboldtii]